MKARLGLRQINQILRNSLVSQDTLNHVMVATAANQSPLQDAASAGGEVIDVAGYRVGQHERQIAVRGLYFGCRLGLDVRVDRKSYFVGFVDRSGLGLLRAGIVFCRLQPRTV